MIRLAQGLCGIIILLVLLCFVCVSADREFTILVEGVSEIDSVDLCDSIKTGVASEGLEISCQP